MLTLHGSLSAVLLFPLSPLPLLSSRTAWCRLCVEGLLGLLDITPWVWITSSITLPSWRQQHSMGRVLGRVESLLPPSRHQVAYLLLCLCSPLATGCFSNSSHQWPGAVFQWSSLWDFISSPFSWPASVKQVLNLGYCEGWAVCLAGEVVKSCY